MEISFTSIPEQELVKVVTPYNQQFVTRCKNFRGTFKNDAWYFDDSIADLVKEAMIETFGVDGTEVVELCTLHIKNFSDYASKDPVVLFGRTIAKARGRDSGARLGDGIIFIKGRYSSGGSVQNWRTEVSDADFLIKDFPLERTKFKDVQAAIKGGWCEVKPAVKKRSQEQIQKEIEKHLAAIEELKAELV